MEISEFKKGEGGGKSHRSGRRRPSFPPNTLNANETFDPRGSSLQIRHDKIPAGVMRTRMATPSAPLSLTTYAHLTDDT